MGTESEQMMIPGAELVRVAQLPVIEERLRDAKRWVEQITAEAAQMECTEENMVEVRKRLAKLRKAFEQFEGKRKEVKEALETPYKRFLAVYQDCISGPFKSADSTLKAKLEETENVQKQACENVCREYFKELAKGYSLSFLKFEDVGLKISLTEAKKKTPSKYFDEISAFISRVHGELESISAMPEAAEISAEYMRNGYSLSDALKTVHARKEAEETERRRLENLRQVREAESREIEKVEAAVHAVEVSINHETPKSAEEPVMKQFKFWATPSQFEAIKPELKALVEAFKREGIQFK